VLEGRGDAGLGHATNHGRAVAADGLGIVAVFSVQSADRRVGRVGAGWNDVHHRRQVDVDAGAREFATPREGLRLQRRYRNPALYQCGWDRREAAALQPLDQPAFLIRGHEEPDAVSVRGGGHSLYLGGQRLDAGDPDTSVVDQPDGAEVGGFDGPLFGRRERAAVDAEHEQLAGPLLLGHRGESPAGARRRLGGVRCWAVACQGGGRRRLGRQGRPWPAG
jgi:hypothetical protein